MQRRLPLQFCDGNQRKGCFSFLGKKDAMDSKQETTSKEDKDNEQGDDEKNLDFIGDFLNVEPPEGSLDVGFI